MPRNYYIPDYINALARLLNAAKGTDVIDAVEEVIRQTCDNQMKEMENDSAE